MAAPHAHPPSVRFTDLPQHSEPTDACPTLAADERRSLSMALPSGTCQARRMEKFSFEPVSLPPSRAASPSPTSRTTSATSARPTPPTTATTISSHTPPVMHSPPLTPAGTASREEKHDPAIHPKPTSDPAMVTPQVSPPHEPPPTSLDASVHHVHQQPPPSAPSSHAPSHPPLPASQLPSVVEPHPKQGPIFTVGPTGDSLPPSRDASPSGSGGDRTPGTSTPNSGSRPYTPQGEREDTYARSRRAAQSRNLESLEARFVYGGREGRSAAGSTYTLPRSRGTDSDREDGKESKRSSIFGAVMKSHRHDGDAAAADKQHHGSMSELKRFFRIGHRKDKEKEKHKDSPAPSVKEKKSKARKSGMMTPPLANAAMSVPFADDHGLESQYGKFGKVLGSGAGGSVRLMKRSSDGVTFAVKQFRARHSYESERDYNKKVTAEFCIGSTLHHGNIIETMDLVNEKNSYFVVMEYAPYDLFAIVMTGKMSREEVACSTLQILNGVTYLHSMGLAHRDLKLDNVVVNEHGIMKIIDFGSAAVFKYPFEDEVVLASGIVGSDPYLAPEVYDLSKYDPQPTDIWSLAIIFCCMTLRRFPWKAPRVSDNSYKLFVSPPNDGPRPITGPLRPASDLIAHAGHDHRSSGSQSEPASRHPSTEATASSEHKSSASTANSQQASQTIKGPWRLLRLLPRESRHIIGRMLEIDPKKRATLDEIIEDKWVIGSSVCTQEEGGRVVRSDNHEHTLEPGAGGSSAPPTQQPKK